MSTNYEFQHELAQMASQSSAQANFDAKKYICGPWLKGAKGGPWTQVFKPAWEAALRTQIDNFASLYDHIVTQACYGGANGPNHPAGAGLAAIGIQSQAAFSVRTSKGYGLILTHIGHDQGIKEKIEEHVRNVLTGAPDVPAVRAATAATAAANAANAAAVAAAAAAGGPAAVLVAVPGPAVGVAGQLPFDWVGQLYAWIDQNLGQARASGLLTASQNSQFENFKITDVGVQRNTISESYAALVRLNNQRTVPNGPMDLWIKYLRQVTFPKLLADQALIQLQTPTFIIAAGPNAGQPDLGALVQHFEELWHVIYDRGVEIKPQAAPKLLPAERSNRVDGMSNTLIVPPEFAVPEGMETLQNHQAAEFNWSGVSQSELHEAYIVQAAGSHEAFAFLRDERNCWICKGYGHTKDKCPSDPKVKRAIGAVIQGLQTLKIEQDKRLRNFRSRPVVKRSGPSPSQRAMQSETVPEEPLIQYDDGGIYTMSGDEIQAPTIANDPVPTHQAAAAAAVIPAPNATAQNAAGAHQGLAARFPQEIKELEALQRELQSNATDATPLPSTTVESNAVTYNNLDSVIDRDFQSSNTLPSFSAETCPPCGDDDQLESDDNFVRDEFFKPRSQLKCALIGAALAVGAVALAIRSGKGRAAMILLTMAAGVQSTSIANNSVTVKIHSSTFSRYNSYDVKSRNGTQSSSPTTSRQHGTMDTGTTECTSGRKKLFPDVDIEEWHPRIKVEVASGVCLPVEFRGAMLMRVRPMGRTSAKKCISIKVPHSLYVPKMPVTLVSTKALFAYCQISTYFNDQLCMVLPTGEVVGFVETTTNYTVVFDDDEYNVPIVRHPNMDKWPWTTHVAERVLVRSTMRQPLPLTWDLLHERLVHFSPERIWHSSEYITGLNITPLGRPTRYGEPCIHCVRGAFRGHRKHSRPPGVYIRFGQRIASDSCAMPKSTPFGFIEMYIFYDMATKYIAVYFGKTTTAAEMLLVYKQFIADHIRYMPKGRVEEWFADGGSEFKSHSLDEFCAEMHTRRRFIAPWNPWMNVAETGWRIILRPLRVVLAGSNVSKALWPFAVNQIVWVHNSLSSSSDTAPRDDATSSFAAAFVASLLPQRHPPSPYFNVTGKPSDLSHLRVLFCEIEVRIRNKDDLRRRDKPDPVTMRGINLGPSTRAHGALVYLFDVQRFTTSSYNDIYYREHLKPRLDRILGTFHFGDVTGTLPSIDQQVLDTGGVDPPELTLPVADRPVQRRTDDDEPPRNPDHGDARTWRPGHCGTPGCEYDAGHPGPCSTDRDDTAHPRRPGLTHRDATRNRNIANIVAAVEGDTSNVLAAPTDHAAFAVAIAGDGDDQIVICYNTTAAEEITSYTMDDEPPKSTAEALNGPRAEEWRAAYAKDLAAKIKNGTFTYVPRPAGVKVIKTKVAHAHKRDDETNSAAITELRARWVGCGFLQGPLDFNATYCATPNATSCRLFLSLVTALSLHLANGDVTKAFTLNPIDVKLHVEQMPGVEVAGDWKGATKENTVCLLHKCLEGLKQAGNVWQTTHSSFLEGLRIVMGAVVCVLKQSIVEPTLFIGHCSKGLIAILVWVDDILVAFSSQPIYDEFVNLYKLRFPSKHKLGCTKFAGLSIDYQRGRQVVIHQKHHLELAFNKFVTDKVAAAKSPYMSRPAVADRNSPLHYSKITLAKNDTEREMMKSCPFLPALATLMYVVHFTNAHLNYNTSFLGQFMHDPSPAGWEAVLGLVIYAYYHRDVDVIVYGGELSIPRVIPQNRRSDFLASYGFHGYCDASWLLRSPAGYFIFLLNGPIDWSSKLIRVICHSSAEAEIAAGCMLGKRMVFVVQLAQEFKVDLRLPGLLLIDNSATEDLCNKFGVTPKTAHFLRWQFYLRWLVIHRWAEIVFVPTKEQLADILTKVVDFSTFVAACNILFKGRTLRAPSSRS